MKTSSRFEFHLCFTEPHGNEVIGFEIYFSWKCDAIYNSVTERERGGTRFDELVLKVESFLIEDLIQADRDGIGCAPLCALRHTRDQKQIVLWNPQRRFRCPLTRSGSGGNWYWQVYHVPFRVQAFLLNFIRRLPHADVTEWQNDFREQVWERRGAIRLDDLRRFAAKSIRASVKEHRERQAA